MTRTTDEESAVSSALLPSLASTFVSLVFLTLGANEGERVRVGQRARGRGWQAARASD